MSVAAHHSRPWRVGPPNVFGDDKAVLIVAGRRGIGDQWLLQPGELDVAALAGPDIVAEGLSAGGRAGDAVLPATSPG